MIIGRGGSVLVRAAWAAVALTAFAAASAAAQDAPLPLEPPLVRGSSTSSESPAAGEPQASASADNPVWPLWYAPLAFLHTRRAGGLLITGLLGWAIWLAVR